MVHWVYVLECEDNFIYVGETRRLYRRFSEHLNGIGAANTHRHKPNKLLGLYKVGDNQSYRNYKFLIDNNRFYDKDFLDDWGEGGDNLAIENAITERYLWERRENHEYGTGKEWYRIRGGKYTYKSLDDTLEMSRAMCSRPGHIKGTYKHISSEISLLKEEDVVDRPLCYHGYPSEVKLSNDKQKIYFVCALKNVWDDFFEELEVEDPCDFWKLYDGDKKLKEIYELNEKRIKESWLEKLPIAKSRMEPEPCIMCKTAEYRPLWACGSIRRLCEECLAYKYDIIKKDYSKNVCLIIDE